MLLFAKTYENTKFHWPKFPIEDAFWSDEGCAIVADWVTRDPIWISDFSKSNLNEFINKYPEISWGTLAANKAIETFKKNRNVSLYERLELCNDEIKKLNETKNQNPDYLENDFFATVAAAVEIKNQTLLYTYICDCGIILYDKNWRVKFQTEDDKKLYSDKYIDKYMLDNWLEWNKPQARYNVRKYFRNGIWNIQDWRCVWFWCLTWEENAKYFIKNWEISINKWDFVIVYSDWLSWFLNDKSFIKKIINFEKEELDSFIKEKSLSDYKKYGYEKTIVLLKI